MRSPASATAPTAAAARVGAAKREGLFAQFVSGVFALDLFAVLPLLPHMPGGSVPTAVPLFIAVRALAVMVLLIPAGHLIDTVSSRRLVPLACMAKAAGFLLVGLAQGPLGFVAAAVLLGAGTAVTRPAMKAIFAQIRTDGAAPQIFAWQSVVLNSAAVGGPCLAQLAVFAGYPREMVAVFVAAELAMAFVTYRWLTVARPRAAGRGRLRAALAPGLAAVYVKQALIGCAATVALSLVLVDGRFAGGALAFQAGCLILVQLILVRSAVVLDGRFDAAALVVAVVVAFTVSSNALLVMAASLAMLAAAEAVLFPALHQQVADRAATGGTATAYSFLGLSQTFGEAVGGATVALLVGAATAGFDWTLACIIAAVLLCTPVLVLGGVAQAGHLRGGS